MAQILTFKKSPFAPLHVRQGAPYRISITVLDLKRPRKTRWQAQFAVQRAAGFRALKGFTDWLARQHVRHAFKIRTKRLLDRFLRDVAELVADGRVEILVDGRPVHLRPRRVA